MLMNVLIPMEDVKTIVLTQLVVITVHVMMAMLLMMMITTALVSHWLLCKIYN